MMTDDSKVVSAIALVLNLPANLLFLYQNSFFWPSAMKFQFSAMLLCTGLVEKSISNVSYSIHLS